MWCLLLGLGARAADLIVDGTVVVLSGALTFDRVEVINGGTISVAPYDGISGGTLAITADSILIDATSAVLADGVGYRGGAAAAAGEGPGGGRATGDNGGGGGGHGGPGGDGLDDVSLLCNAYDDNNGFAYDTAVPSTTAEPGSGGAGGNGNGTGGNGGGAIALHAPLIEVYGVISADGAVGIGGANDGGGGGAGGGILLAGDTLICTGSLEAAGATGGFPTNLTDGGGGGGGGVVEQYWSTAGTPCTSVDTSNALDRCGGTGGGTSGVATAEAPGDTFFDWDNDGSLAADCDVHDPAVGDPTDWFLDVDGDGFGDGPAVSDCVAPIDHVAVGGDCDDGNGGAFPGAPEVPADGVDQSCDGSEDCYDDADLDGFGDALVASIDADCTDPGEAALPGDCDPLADTIWPGAPEVAADGIDQDCDGGDTCFLDGDLDGAGQPMEVAGADLECDGPGESSTGDDCDDADAAAYPGAPELPGDGTDQDCDGGEVCFVDADGDAHGTPALQPSPDLACDPAAGEAPVGDDCDDTDDAIFPGQLEIPGDGVDQDCDGLDGCFDDADGDGFGSTAVIPSLDGDCLDPGESANALDCDDSAGAVNPAAPETPGDEVDQDCDGIEGCFVDDDGDGSGIPDVIPSADVDCADPGEADDPDDCDDTDDTIYPEAFDVPGDGIDQDCDGLDALVPPDTGDTGAPPLDTGGAPTPAALPSVADRAPPEAEDAATGCGCATGAPGGSWLPALAVLTLGRRRRG